MQYHVHSIQIRLYTSSTSCISWLNLLLVDVFLQFDYPIFSNLPVQLLCQNLFIDRELARKSLLAEIWQNFLIVRKSK